MTIALMKKVVAMATMEVAMDIAILKMAIALVNNVQASLTNMTIAMVIVQLFDTMVTMQMSIAVAMWVALLIAPGVQLWSGHI